MSHHLGLPEVAVQEGVSVCVHMGPEGGGGGVEREPMSLLVTVTQKCSKPARRKVKDI